ncbi:MAG: hypothetical protein N2258_00160 [Brevinematales bacterium]|nr:hypothetical protein [Brevinematales bacterium]
MEWVKISLFMIGFLIFELLVGFILYLFAVNIKDIYVIFSIITLIFIFIGLFYSRHKEKKKVIPSKKLYEGYRKSIIITFSVIFTFLLLFFLFSIILVVLNK